MKKLFFTLAMAVTLLNSYSQDNDKNKENNEKITDVPAKVKSSFLKLYPNISEVKWEKEGKYYEAEFKSNNKETEVEFKENGQLVQTEVSITISELPKQAQDYIAKNYQGVKFDEISEVTNSNKKKTYQLEANEKTIIFDSNGKFVKEEKEDDDDDD